MTWEDVQFATRMNKAEIEDCTNLVVEFFDDDHVEGNFGNFGPMGGSATTARRRTTCPLSATQPRCLETQRTKTLDLPLPPTFQGSSLP